jgi:hypothetical protein
MVKTHLCSKVRFFRIVNLYSIPFLAVTAC